MYSLVREPIRPAIQPPGQGRSSGALPVPDRISYRMALKFGYVVRWNK
jgi:hypothetical protein